jgi:hypothetical protein
MPLAWIYDLFKQQVERLAGQLGLPTDGAMDDLRKRVKEEWTAMKTYLPSQSASKSLYLRSLFSKILIILFIREIARARSKLSWRPI